MKIVTPITLTNSQSQATPSNFQQLIQTTLQYPNGVRFWSPTDGYLPAWLESIQSNSANIWVKIPSSIPANGTYQLYMIQDSTLPMDGVYWGEAPQLSPTYGEYDNGANVFNFYDNFAGTSLNTNKWTAVTTGGSVTVNNGITIQDNGSGSGEGIVSKIGVSPNSVFEVYRESQGGGDTSTYALALFNTATIQASISGYEYEGWTGGYFASTYTNWEDTTSISTATPFPSSTPVVVGIAWLATGDEYTEIGSNGAFTHYTDSSLTISSSIYPGIGNSEDSAYVGQTDYWVRVRAYPPNGVMPTASFGTPQYSGELITVTVP